MKQFRIFILLLFISLRVFTQNYCINLEKDKKSIILKRNKTVTFSVLNDSVLVKAQITGITADSITFFLKKEQQKKTVSINKIKALAYTKKSFWVALPTYYLAMGVMSAASNGTPIQPVDFFEPKGFRKTMKIEDGWKAKVISCP